MTGSSTPYSPDGLSRTSSASDRVVSESAQPRRPATIAELAAQAQVDAWDPNRDLKHWLRLAQKLRNDGKQHAEKGELEQAFILYARSATIVLERLPEHPDYHTLLTPQQRLNLGLNGQDILESLSKLKPTLVDIHSRWQAEHEDRPHPDPHPPVSDPREDDHHPPPDDIVIPPSWNPEDDGIYDLNTHMDGLRVTNTDEDPRGRWQHFHDDREPRARKDSSTARRLMHDHVGRPRADSASRRMDDRRRMEQEGIVRRQREAEAAAAHAVRSAPVSIPQAQSSYHPISRARSPPVMPFGGRPNSIDPTHDYRKRQPIGRESTWDGGDVHQPSRQSRAIGAAATMPAPEHRWEENYYRHPTPDHTLRPSGPAVTMPSSFPDYTPAQGLEPLPLENPNLYESDTDRESNEGGVMIPGSGHGIAIPVPRHHTHTPARNRRPSYPPPMTTTSPAPRAFPIRYPSLMSLHQREQGYKPSARAMFVPESTDYSPHTESPGTLYDSTPRSYQTLGDRVIPSPPSDIRPPSLVSGSSYDVRTDVSSATAHLKTVTLPRECLHRFLSIAAVNTSANLETCGLLLGKDKGSKYAVTTLLIPRQRATADTCAMEEEELVLQFTEERDLITLGWIHTHPSQSCFMSSLDLHTHAGFQRMLPESFAIVCSPKFQPNFGIFRLTEPPGLDIILSCTAHEAFHPHPPNAPIYTDADKGHVVIKESSIEIVDLR